MSRLNQEGCSSAARREHNHRQGPARNRWPHDPSRHCGHRSTVPWLPTAFSCRWAHRSVRVCCTPRVCIPSLCSAVASDTSTVYRWPLLLLLQPSFIALACAIAGGKAHWGAGNAGKAQYFPVSAVHWPIEPWRKPSPEATASPTDGWHRLHPATHTRYSSLIKLVSNSVRKKRKYCCLPPSRQRTTALSAASLNVQMLQRAHAAS